MRRIPRVPVIILVVLVLVGSLAGLVAVLYHPTSQRPIGSGVLVSGSNLPGNLHATVSQAHAPFSPKLASIASQTFQIGPSGKLNAPITIQLPLAHTVR